MAFNQFLYYLYILTDKEEAWRGGRRIYSNHDVILINEACHIYSEAARHKPIS